MGLLLTFGVVGSDLTRLSFRLSFPSVATFSNLAEHSFSRLRVLLLIFLREKNRGTVVVKVPGSPVGESSSLGSGLCLEEKFERTRGER